MRYRIMMAVAMSAVALVGCGDAKGKGRAETAPAVPCSSSTSQGGKCAVAFDNPEFQLHLGGDWTQVATSDPEQFNFESKTLKTSVVISVLHASIPREKLLAAANALAD